MKTEVTIREAFNTDSEEVGKTLSDGEYELAMTEALIVGISEKNPVFEHSNSLLFIVQETRGDIMQAIVDGKEMYIGKNYDVNLPKRSEVSTYIRAIEKREKNKETEMVEVDGQRFKIGKGTPKRLAGRTLLAYPSQITEKDGVANVALSGDNFKEFFKTGIRATDLRIKEVEKAEPQEKIEKGRIRRPDNKGRRGTTNKSQKVSKADKGTHNKRNIEGNKE